MPTQVRLANLTVEADAVELSMRAIADRMRFSAWVWLIGIWSVEPEGEGTRYTARARHWTEEAAKQHAEMGFEQGWGACADQLKLLCESA